MGKRTPKSVKASCDKLFSKIVRSEGYCTRCGSTRYLQCAHIYSRRYLNLRHEEENAVCLCAGCHRWGHDHPIEFVEYIKQIRDVEKLKLKKEVLVKRKLNDWLELEKELKEKYDRL